MIKTTCKIAFFVLTLAAFSSCGGGGGGGGTTGGDTSGGGGGSTTGAITVTPNPQVVAKSTDGNSGAVSTSAAITVTFSKNMNAATITTSTFSIAGVSGTVSYNPTLKTSTFTPGAAFNYNTTYTATLTTGVQDSVGNAMAASFVWRFRTTSPPVNSSVLLAGSVQGNSLRPDVTSVLTFAGNSIGSTNGTGTGALFNQPYGITTDGTNLFVTDSQNHTIRKIVISTGVVTTIAGTAGSSGTADGTGSVARFNRPQAVTTDGVNLYVADSYNYTIRQIVISTGVVTTIAGTAGVNGTADGTGTAASFGITYGITTDGTNLYVADGNFTFRKIVLSTGVVTTLAGGAGIIGGLDGTGTAARFGTPAGITTDGTNLYVGDSNCTIRKIVISTGVVTTIAGIVAGSGSSDGIGSAARFSFPTGITTDGTNLFVVDSNRVRKIVLSTLVVTTPALISNATGIVTDGINLFVTTLYSHTIKKVYGETGVAITVPPSGLGATVSDGQLVLDWPSVPGATSYNLYCAPGTSVTTSTGTKIPKVASPYYLGSYWTATPIAIVNDTNYSCIVTAENDLGETVAASSVTTATPTATYLLTVTKIGTSQGGGSAGTGTVTSSPSGISCGSTCAATVTNGATVVLTATAASDSTFTGWSGATMCLGTGTCTVTMTAAQTAVANFLGSPPAGSYYWSNWTCSSGACASIMGGYSGSVGNFCTLSDCNACNAGACIGIYGGSCALTPAYASRVVRTPSNGTCLRSGFDF